MKTPMIAAALGALALSLVAEAASAGPISRACMRSDRDAANSAICGCIQQVADQTLTGSDQRRAAKFFANPDAAQKVFLSKSNSDDAFWDRYKNLGATAEAYRAG